MRTFAMADIHGRSDKLKQCLSLVNFTDDDRLIQLGDVCDLGPDTKGCLDILTSINNLVMIRGNHDSSTNGCFDGSEYGWALKWFMTGEIMWMWQCQGGEATMRSYDSYHGNVPESHITLLKNAVPYYIDEQNNLYVHGGFNHKKPIEEQDPEYLMWDRKLINKKCKPWGRPIAQYNRVFFGHTAVQAIRHDKSFALPIIKNNCIALDTGSSKLTIMDVDTLEYWQA